MKNKVIIIAPFARNGITAVIKNLIKSGITENSNIIFHPSTFESYGFRKIYLFVSQFIKFIEIFFRFKPDLIHVHTSTYGSFYRKSVYIVFSKIFKKKIIIHIHPTHFLEFVKHSKCFKKFFILEVLRMASLIITLTDRMRIESRKLIGEKQSFYVLNNPLYLDDYMFNSIKFREKNTLLYLGWIIKNKGVYDLLKAYPYIKRNVKNLHLIYCGNKETEKLRKIVKEKNLSNFITVREWVEFKEKKKLLMKTNALILPSYTEGIPNVLLEAMASGLPILTTPVGGIPTFLEDKKNCLYFSPGNIKEMAKKIVRLLKDTNLQKDIAQNNLEQIKKFDAKLVTNKLLDIYNKPLFEE